MLLCERHDFPIFTSSLTLVSPGGFEFLPYCICSPLLLLHKMEVVGTERPQRLLRPQPPALAFITNFAEIKAPAVR
uniref:Uncharacterized protein n=1 Tax=Arundo donax TaxID=35708 RepID=A0A0A9C9T0_ARUDO